jgi:hypothetical protein
VGREVKLGLNLVDVAGYKMLVDVYPVGLWMKARTSWRVKRWRMNLRHEWRCLVSGDWRALRNSFNGYLAEPDVFVGSMTRAGRGWTRKMAMRSLIRHANKPVKKEVIVTDEQR